MKPMSKLSPCLRHKLNQAHALILKPIWTVNFPMKFKSGKQKR